MTREALVILAAVSLMGPAAPAGGGDEVHLSNKELKKLDTFEGHLLQKADKAFGEGKFKLAASQYDAFILEFGRSGALPYALLRKARSVHRDGKRYEAIKRYNEVLDYFPNAVRYAAAALYYQGLCHWQNGDEEEAVKTWARMARDVDYSKHRLAAGAINRLADYLSRTKGLEQAVDYYRQVAVDFRRSNSDAARHAMHRVIYHDLRHDPSEPKLRDFYRDVGGFHGWRIRRDLPEHLGDDRAYWDFIRREVLDRKYDDFSDSEQQLRKRYYRYWAEQMAGRFDAWDAFHIRRLELLRRATGDAGAWIAGLDRQFADHQEDGDYGRVIRWIGLFAGQPAKMQEYYEKLQFEKLDYDRLRRLMEILYTQADKPAMGRNVFEKIDLSSISDDRKPDLARFFHKRDGELAVRVYRSFSDADRGRMELLRYYHGSEQYDKGIKLAGELAGVAEYASEALFRRGEMLQRTGKHAEAVGSYQQADNPPRNLWRIAECYEAMGRVEQAVAQLREIENFFEGSRPQAALRIAWVYDRAGQAKQKVAALRAVLKKYPKSGPSSRAHQELEKMGIKTGGGVDAE